MDDYTRLGEIDFAPREQTDERLALLSLEEAHDLLRLSLVVAAEGSGMSAEATRLAKEIAARVPAQN
ncbi:DUF6417 family protein [Streptomyces sp. NPDC101151]|uniref:DUF6417 family protein n=1 Tax=Streptomyces sp. NPDC101151 TaxID=3366115 RepID=UPI00380100CE